jgi:hypothetical protein
MDGPLWLPLHQSICVYSDAIESSLVPNLVMFDPCNSKEDSMANDQQTQDQKTAAAPPTPAQEQGNNAVPAELDGLKNKKPEDLTPEELRLMADTMPGEGPGD